ncbi:small VCP/p97-interacting protein [Diretmus argenteus]
MGMCLPCLGGAADDVVVTPDPETRRQQLAEAAEKRKKETTYRGVKNPEAVERKRKKQEDIEKQTMTTSVSGGGLKIVIRKHLRIKQLRGRWIADVMWVQRLMDPHEWQVG